MKKILVFSYFFILSVFFPKNIFADFNPSTTTVAEFGPILVHGQTLDDLWGNQTNHPPTDGSIKTWSFYPNGRQIITIGDMYWIIDPDQTRWINGSLKTKWQSCTNFPSGGVDAYSIRPSTGEEFAFSGIYLYSINSSGECTINGSDWKAHWETEKSPSGNQPLRDHNSVDQFQWLGDDSQIVITDNLIWLYGADTSSRGLNCTMSGGAWHFCEPETLYDRWVVKEKYENHPPTDKIGVFAVSYNPNYHIYVYGNYIWTLGKDNLWDTFRSGFDGYGARDPFLMKDNNKYYLYYDAMNGNTNWVTAVAVADHPKGPWKKLGPIQFSGAIRPWEQGCSCASSVFKVGNKYYNFYLGAPGTTPDIYHIPQAWLVDNRYYRLGLAVADNPLGPFRRLQGDGTENNATTADPPLLTLPSSGWHSGMFASAQGSLLNVNGRYYYTTTSQDSQSARWGIGIVSADNVLGPWSELPNALIPFSAMSENSSILFDANSGYYLLFSNAIYSPQETRWRSYFTNCDQGWGQGVGLVMYWSKDLFNWDWQNNYRVVAASSGNKGCFGDGNYTPGSSLLHEGSVGLGSAVFIPEENKLYVAFDGNNFSLDQGSINHMFRNIFLLSIDLPALSPLPGDLDHDNDVDIFDYNLFVGNFGNTTCGNVADIDGNCKVDIFDYNTLAQNFGH